MPAAHTHTLYLTAGSGNSFKPALVLQQRQAPLPDGREVRRIMVDVLGGATRTPTFLDLNPRGQVPFLVTAGGERLGESNAIAWFLAEGSTLMPTQAIHRAQALQWMIFEQTALEPNLSPARFFSRIVPHLREAHAEDFPRWHRDGHAGLAVLDAHLRGRHFLCDHGYSVADIAVYGYTHLAAEGGFRLGDYPAVQAWMERMKAQPDHRALGELLAT